jgi:predicted glycoside hydrolase/deacetylase ChbG (UPF0249 family)
LTSTRPIRISFCADDFGLDAGVNDGITRLAQAGRLQAVGAMVGAPAFGDGVPALARLGGMGLDVGLHFDLTQYPLRTAPTKLGAIIAASLTGRIAGPQIGAEFQAQLDAFEDAMGRPPDFVDGHQHVHQLPGVADIVVAELVRRGIKPWLRCSRPRHAAGAGGWDPKSLVIDALGRRRTSRMAAKAGLSQNRWLLGVYGFTGDAAQYRRRLHGWIAAAGDGDLLMCHPALGDNAADPIRAARQREFEVLSGDDWSAILAKNQVEVGRMTAILADDVID